MDSLSYHYIGRSQDDLLVFQDLDYPSDAPQGSALDTASVQALASTDQRIDGQKYFAITTRHAEIRGLLGLVLDRLEAGPEAAMPF